MTFASANAQTPPDPAEVNYDPADAGVIFAADQDKYFEVLRDGNGNPASDWSPVSWGQTAVVSNDECDGGASAIRVDGLDFLPLQFKGTISLAKWRYLHIDLWVPSDDKVCFKLQNWFPGEAFVTCIYDLKGGEWASIDIDMEDPEYFQWGEQKTDPETQEKYINKGVNVFQVAGEKLPNDYPHASTMFMTNIIAHNGDNAGVENVVVSDRALSGRTYNIFGIEVDENYKGIVVRDGRKFYQR